MNKKVSEQFKDIKDIYLLQCICTEQNEENERLNKKLKREKERNKKSNDIIKKLKNIVEKSKYFKLVYTDEEMEHIWDKTIINKMDEIIEILKGGE